MVKVCLELFPVRIVCLPSPIFIYFRDAQLVNRNRRVDPSTGVDVPTPKGYDQLEATDNTR